MFFVYNYYYIVALLLLIGGYKLAPELFQFKIDKVIKFVKFILTFVTIAAVVRAFVIHKSYPQGVAFPFEALNTLFGVWWEDLFFVLPYLLIHRFFGNRGLLFASPLILITTNMFVQGHMYQVVAGYLSVLYPLVSFHYSKKHGITTVMLCHVLYDVIVVAGHYGLTSVFLDLIKWAL